MDVLVLVFPRWFLVAVDAESLNDEFDGVRCRFGRVRRMARTDDAGWASKWYGIGDVYIWRFGGGDALVCS